MLINEIFFFDLDPAPYRHNPWEQARHPTAPYSWYVYSVPGTPVVTLSCSLNPSDYVWSWLDTPDRRL